MDLKNPLRLTTSRAWRTYLGGSMISRLHGKEEADDHFPEEWLMSAVAARNSGREHIVEGMSFLADTNLTLKELTERYPKELLGEAHAAKYGSALGVLVKLLDAAERLTVQVHPTRDCAMKLFSSPFGKTECWHIIDRRTEDACIYLGFKPGVTREVWKRCFDTQDIEAMLSCLHRIPVQTGDTFIIHGGVPHAIGAGCFLVEIQEPTDYTVRTERITPSGLAVSDFMCHQGLGFDRMFDCFVYDGMPLEETLARYRVTPERESGNGYTVEHLIYPAVTDMFALDKITVDTAVTLKACGAFYGIYILDGKGKINGTPLNACDHYLIPAACGDLLLEAEAPLSFIRCFGPKQSE